MTPCWMRSTFGDDLNRLENAIFKTMKKLKRHAAHITNDPSWALNRRPCFPCAPFAQQRVAMAK
jgi:hypothetical protein